MNDDGPGADSALPAAAEAATAALPGVLHDRPAATLLVDLRTATVVHVNALALELAPDEPIPAPLSAWSRAAGLRDAEGRPLEDTGHALLSIAGGEPSKGMAVTAARAYDDSVPRERLWVVSVPLTDAPGPLADQCLVILLPVREDKGVRQLRAISDDLHSRAATASQLSFTISDPHQPDNPLVWVNPAFERVTGYRADDALGRNCRFLQGPGTDRAAIDRIRAALAADEPVAETILNYRADGTPFWNQVVISPILDDEGLVTHHVGIQADVSPRMDAEREQIAALEAARVSSGRLQLLAQVSETLAQHLDYSDAVAALADVTVPRLAAWGFVAVTNDQGRFERLHLAARDPSRAEDTAALETEEVSWLTRSPSVTAALAADSSYVAAPFPVDIESLPGRTTPTQLALLRRLGLGHALVVPLRARDRVIGVLVLVNPPGRPFSDEETVTAAHIGYRAGLGLDNVRLYQRERAAALTLQRSLLPEVPPLEGLDVAASYLPALHRAEVGGDWFDAFVLKDGVVGLAVGDVVGHDIQAAAAMGQLRSVLRSYAWSGAGTGRVVGQLDEVVRSLSMADIATCIYLRLEPDGGLTYSRAGHPPPLVRDPGGAVRALDGALTTPIGVVDFGEEAPEARTTLGPGSTLVVYTDGLVERRTRSLSRGMAELADLLSQVPDDASAADVRDMLVGALVGPEQEDDVCLLVVRRHPPA